MHVVNVLLSFSLPKWLDSCKWKGFVFSVKTSLMRSIGLCYAVELLYMCLILLPFMFIKKGGQSVMSV